ncbi:MAG: hypothetical protein HY353_03755 [Candidatus Omnitrophica bacterium]|nr:hypothetical protein [Candidatus Omnitrophota bacterium]
MSSECGSGSCETQGSTSEQAQCGKCPCGTSGCSGDPMDCAIGMWTCSFFEAMKQAQVELLKPKIQKAWGSKMDKAAEAVLEAMGVQWQSMVAQGQAKAELKEKLAALWKESR